MTAPQSGGDLSRQIGNTSTESPTLEQLRAAFPHAAVETSCSGEVVIYTGWAIASEDTDGPLVQWCDECESGDEIPDEGCGFCGRQPERDDEDGSPAEQPDSHYGTCAVCGEPTVWCVAGYWTHAGEDHPRDHVATTDPGRSPQGSPE